MPCRSANPIPIEPAEYVPIPGIWQTLANTLDGVVKNSTYEDHVPTVEAFLTSLVCPLQPELKFVEEAIETLYNTQGMARIDQLAAEMYLSHRQLDRQFKQQVGITPKRLARLIRFEAVVNQLMTNPATRLDELAFEFGYTDTAHFTNDFKAIAERTPGEFAALAREGRASDVFKIPEPRTIYSLCTVYVRAHAMKMRHAVMR
jgi:AraC-like DNA-binding protein